MNTTIDVEKVKELFEKYDLNRNGILEREEFVAIFQRILNDLGEHFPEKKNVEVCDEGLNNFDLNKNGKLEFNEFYELMSFLVTEKGYPLK